MAKIVLTEKQFKDYCRILLKEKRKKEYVKKMLREATGEGVYSTEPAKGTVSPEVDQ